MTKSSALLTEEAMLLDFQKHRKKEFGEYEDWYKETWAALPAALEAARTCLPDDFVTDFKRATAQDAEQLNEADAARDLETTMRGTRLEMDGDECGQNEPQ